MKMFALAACIMGLFAMAACASPQPSASVAPAPATTAAQAPTPAPPPAPPAPPPPPAAAPVYAPPSDASAQSRIAGNPVLQALTTSFSARHFIPGEIPHYDIEAILLSGARAQSARNAQPWRFTVITNYADVRSLRSDAAEGNVIIVISGRINNTLPTTDFDCGIAAAYMQLAAEALGYGVRIVVSPVGAIEQRRAQFDIPGGYRVVMGMLIGTASDAVDGFSSATPRNPLDDIVNWAQ